MVPSGWEHLSIDQILTIGSGKDYKHLSSGDIPVYGSGGHMLNVSEYLYDGDSVCIGRKGTIDKPFFLSGKFWTVDTLFFTHSFRKTIPQYVYQYFLTINWRKYSEASGVPSLSKAIIQNIKLNLPPIPEQHKIANILGAWDKAISTTERLIDNSKQQKKALMQQLLTGKKRLLDNSGKPFEGEWKEVRLGEVCSKVTDGAHHSPKSVDSGYPMYSVKDMKPTGFAKNTARLISEPDFFSLVKQNCKPEINDILIAKDGSILKYCFVVKEEIRGVILSSIALLRPKLSIIQPEFIAQYFSQESIKYFVGKALTSGSGVPRIILKDFKGIHLKIPSIVEQQKISLVLINADNEIELLEQQLADLKQEKKALMQQLLTGKRRVLA